MTEDRKARMASVLGETAVVVGNLRGLGDLEIRGRVQGSVELQGRLLVAASGVVLGSVEATTVTISGEVRGDLTAREVVLIEASGQVEGNVAAPRVAIEAGARVRGNLRTGDAVPASPTSPVEVSPDEWPPPSGPTSDPASDEVLDEEEMKATPEAIIKQGRTRPRKRKRPRRTGEPRPAPVSALPPPKADPAAAAQDAPTRANDGASMAPSMPQKGGAARIDTPRLAPADAPQQRAPADERRGPPRPPTFVKGTKGHQRV